MFLVLSYIEIYDVIYETYAIYDVIHETYAIYDVIHETSDICIMFYVRHMRYIMLHVLFVYMRYMMYTHDIHTGGFLLVFLVLSSFVPDSVRQSLREVHLYSFFLNLRLFFFFSGFG